MNLLHLIKYKLIISLRAKDLLFWCLAFPIIMLTLFGTTFANADFGGQFQKIPVYIDYIDYIADENTANFYDTVALNAHVDGYFKGIESLVDIKNYSSRAEADEKLLKNEIAGIFEVRFIKEKIDGKEKNANTKNPYQPDISLVVSKNGISSSVLKSLADSFKKSKAIGSEFKDPKQIADFYKNSNVRFEELSATGKRNNPYTMSVFAMLAFNIFQASQLALSSAMSLEANLSVLGARNSAAPVKKSIFIISNYISDCIAYTMVMSIVYLYANYTFRDFNLFIYLKELYLLTITGVIMASGIGYIVGIVTKANEHVKSGVMTSLGLTFSFASGMMGMPSIKLYFDTQIPINKINPISAITDSMLQIYEFNDFEKFYSNIKIMLIVSAILFAISVIIQKKQVYDSL